MQRTIPAGTTIHIDGIPVFLLADVEGRSHPGNWKLIDAFIAARKQVNQEDDNGPAGGAEGLESHG